MIGRRNSKYHKSNKEYHKQISALPAELCVNKNN
jgi:hypothetical protein